MRDYVVLVDKNGEIKNVVIGMRLIVDMLEVTYIANQSIDNGCFTSVSVAPRNEGENRAFLVKIYGRSVEIKQLKQPKTFAELDVIRAIVEKFNS